jgi:hypothetical protein
MIHIFDNYYIFGYEDLHWYQLRCKVNDKISLMEDLVVGANGILYCNYFTMSHIAYNLSDVYKMISDCRDFEENYGTNWAVNDTKLFPGYFKEWVFSMEWIYNDINYNFTEYWKTIIGNGSLLKTWINPPEIDTKTQCETHQVGPTISFCKDSKNSMSFDCLPSDYFLPIILKKIT